MRTSHSRLAWPVASPGSTVQGQLAGSLGVEGQRLNPPRPSQALQAPPHHRPEAPGSDVGGLGGPSQRCNLSGGGARPSLCGLDLAQLPLGGVDAGSGVALQRGQGGRENPVPLWATEVLSGSSL